MEPTDATSAWRPAPPPKALARICCLKHVRVVANDHTVRAGATIVQLPSRADRRSYAGARVELQYHLDGRLVVWDGERELLSQRADLAETVNGLYKAELIHRQGPWRSVEQVELATARWVAWWNRERLHGACGDIPPAEFEAAYWSRQAQAARLAREAVHHLGAPLDLAQRSFEHVARAPALAEVLFDRAKHQRRSRRAPGLNQALGRGRAASPHRN